MLNYATKTDYIFELCKKGPKSGEWVAILWTDKEVYLADNLPTYLLSHDPEELRIRTTAETDMSNSAPGALFRLDYFETSYNNRHKTNLNLSKHPKSVKK